MTVGSSSQEGALVTVITGNPCPFPCSESKCIKTGFIWLCYIHEGFVTETPKSVSRQRSRPDVRHPDTHSSAPILPTSRHITSLTFSDSSSSPHSRVPASSLQTPLTFKEDSLRHRRVNALQPNCHNYSCDQFQRPFSNTFLLLTSVLLQSVTFGFLLYL